VLEGKRQTATTKGKDFWAASAILIATIAVMLVVILHWVSIGFFVGPFRLNHWFVWIGTIYIAITVPTIAILKRRHLQRYGTLLRTHMFGNLLAFMLISLHFASQISRPANAYPDLGTGLALYTAMVLLVGTGFLQRFQPTPNSKPKSYRFIHTGLAVAFYLIIIVHILHGLAIL
jgi:hypothetical protein